MDENDDNKYCIVRTARASLDLLIEKYNRSCWCYLQTYSYGRYCVKFLKSKPRHTTLVHICGIARMGQELDIKLYWICLDQRHKSILLQLM